MFGGGSTIWEDRPVDSGDLDYDCPHEVHMETPSLEGIGILIGISLFLIGSTVILCYLSYKKW